MPATTEQLDRSGDLKRQLVEFAQSNRFSREFRRALTEAEQQGTIDPYSEAGTISFLDVFALQHRLKDGRVVVDHFVAARQDLSEEDKAVVLGWRDVVDGLFEVQRHDGDAITVLNLIDDLTYRVRSNMGRAVLDQMPERSFLVGRIVPLADEWLISGLCRPVPASAQPDVYRMAAQVSASTREAVYRNPDKLALGWDLQRKDRDRFLSYFGADEIVMTGAEFSTRMPEYWDFCANVSDDRPSPVIELPDDLWESESIGLVYDEVLGLLILIEYATVKAVFEDPALVRDLPHRQRIRSYLKDDTIPPAVFRRLADRDPAKASQVFRHLLNQPGFSWETDGDALLRRHKQAHFDKPPLPSITPLSDRLAKYARS